MRLPRRISPSVCTEAFVQKTEAKSGTWVHMPKGLRHSIQAKTLMIMLLLHNLP
jgi:hypothetical protein